eukprot:15345-Heterococcus_DN1.PRE.1
MTTHPGAVGSAAAGKQLLFSPDERHTAKMPSCADAGAMPSKQVKRQDDRPLTQRMWEVTKEYLPLCLITFGGPPAHIALLHDRFVVQRKWLSETLFVELFAIGSALPGPASTQLAFSVALMREGIIPALWSFCIWSLPGGVVMALLGTVIGSKPSAELPEAVLYLSNGLASAALALIALAAYKLGNKLCKTKMTKIIGALSAAFTMCFTDEAWMIPFVMAVGGIAAYAVHLYEEHKRKAAERSSSATVTSDDALVAAMSNGEAPSATISNGNGTTTTTTNSSSTTNGNNSVISANVASAVANGPDAPPNNTTAKEKMIAKAVDLDDEIDASVALQYGWRAVLLRNYADGRAWQVLGVFFYVGTIVFGGGPVVIPLLFQYIVEPGWAEPSAFLLGLAIINSMPAFCGALSLRKFGAAAAFGGAAIAWAGIFVPGILTIMGVLPLWHKYRGFPLMKIIFGGVNAAAVGLVFSAVYLLWEKTLSIGYGCAFVAVGMFNVPAPAAIVAGGIVGLLDYAAAR